VIVRFAGALALAVAYVFASPSPAAAQGDSSSSQTCELHLYPADGPHSVGEDFDAVHRVDQDLKHYYETAGRSLDWLTPARQRAILHDLPIAELAGMPPASVVTFGEPLSRHKALEPAPHATSASDCLLDVMVPQIMLERGGLASRSLRVFGIVRRFNHGALVRTYSGDAAAPMTGFQLKSAGDAESATQIVEQAYRAAVEAFLRNSAKPSRK
jgi:hypothetical protein